VKNLKPSKRQSTYGNSFTQGQLFLHNQTELKHAEEYLTEKKRKAKDTNLPGFSELKVAPDVMASLLK